MRGGKNRGIDKPCKRKNGLSEKDSPVCCDLCTTCFHLMLQDDIAWGLLRKNNISMKILQIHVRKGAKVGVYHLGKNEKCSE